MATSNTVIRNIKDIDADTVRVSNTFKLPTIFLTLSPAVPFPTKGLMIFNTNPAIANPGCSDIWYGDGLTWKNLELCLPPGNAVRIRQ